MKVWSGALSNECLSLACSQTCLKRKHHRSQLLTKCLSFCSSRCKDRIRNSQNYTWELWASSSRTRPFSTIACAGSQLLSSLKTTRAFGFLEKHFILLLLSVNFVSQMLRWQTKSLKKLFKHLKRIKDGNRSWLSQFIKCLIQKKVFQCLLNIESATSFLAPYSQA